MKLMSKIMIMNIACKNLRECTINGEMVGSKKKTSTVKARLIL